jgi:colanic acid/amylovoran biosynthesis glycosyltransferase
MRIAYLILAHDKPTHLARLVRALSSPNCGFFIHVDRKSNLDIFSAIKTDNVFFSERRIPVYRGEFSMVQATLLLIRQALGSPQHFEYFVLLGGGDYPLRSSSYIERFFEINRGKEFISHVEMPCEDAGKPITRLTSYKSQSASTIKRHTLKILEKGLAKSGLISILARDYKKYLGDLVPYAGSQRWALSRGACEYILEFAHSQEEIVEFFANTVVPDEMFFQTILCNSSFKERTERALTYTDWRDGCAVMITERHVEVFERHFNVVVNDVYGEGELLFARPFSDNSEEIIARIDRMMEQKNKASQAKTEDARVDNRTLRVAFVVNQFPVLSETFILRQVIGLLERGHEVDIFAFSRPADSTSHADVEKYRLLGRTCYLDDYIDAPSRLRRLAKRFGLLITNVYRHPRAVLGSLNVFKFGKEAILLRVFNQIYPFLDKGPYDIVHCQFGPLGELGLLLRDTDVFSSKIITSFRGYDISSYVRANGDDIYNELFKRGDLFLCVSEHLKEKLINLGCDESKIVVHRSGVDTKKYPIHPQLAERHERVRVLTVARLTDKKGVEYGIRAVAKALEKYPRLEYKIAGDGPLREKLQCLIADLRVGDSVKLVGWKSQDEIAQLLQKSDIVLAPSVTAENGGEEGIPGVIMEAFAQGLPVVSTYHAGIPEVVQDRESGFLVPERDVDALAEKLQSLVEQAALRLSMGRNGRDFVKEQCDIEKLNDRLVDMYQKLLRGKSPNMPPTPYLSSALSPSKPIPSQG